MRRKTHPKSRSNGTWERFISGSQSQKSNCPGRAGACQGCSPSGTEEKQQRRTIGRHFFSQLMNSSIRREIFTRLRSVNPHPTTELEYGSPFELLVAVVLSAQATDKGVNLATRKLFPKANTPEKILALGEAGLREIIKSIGLYKT